MNEVATVIVTYNRKELLRECVEALLESMVKSDIYIIDNNSTDGTKEYISDLCSNTVIYKHLKKNAGGAGGFSAGIDYAVRRGYKYVWIMDDDTIVKPDTLDLLLQTADKLHDNFGFLSSSVAWIDGSDCKMNRQTYKTKFSEMDMYYRKQDLWPVKAASFVSLLINADAVKHVGLPKREYFIWGDDKEYTLRISRYYDCYNVAESKVVHKMKDNTGSNIAKDDAARIDRYFYAYRNDFATARDSRDKKALLIYAAGFALNAVRVICTSKDNKLKRLGVMISGLHAGLRFSPRIRYTR